MDIGSQIVLQATFHNRAGALADPDTVRCWVKRKSQNVGSLVVMTRVTVGIWEALYTIIESGEHKWRVEGTGAVAIAQERSFVVREQTVAHV